MKKRILIFTHILLILLGIAFVAYNYQTKKPPVADLNQAAKKLSEAEALHANYYAKEAYNFAKICYDSAFHRLSVENNRNIIARNYDHITVFTNKSIQSSKEAIQLTKDHLKSIKGKLSVQLDETEKLVIDFDAKYKHFPIRKADKEDFVKSKLLCNEGRLNFESEQFEACATKLDWANRLLKKLHAKYQSELSAYFSNYDTWQTWINETIRQSKQSKGNCIIVDKYAREARLYVAGKLQHTYDIELSENWAGNKMYQGDKATPEGRYKIKAKKAHGSTKYYKALLIDYPNDDDRIRFNAKKKNNQLQRSAKIGGLIEIHGGGGKGYDWTDGCVALTNDEMDHIFKFTSVGTPVTIVGSSIPLEDARKILAQKLGHTKSALDDPEI